MVGTGQRYSHLTWSQVLPLVEAVWGSDHRSEVIAYVDTVRTVIENLAILRPAEQRAAVLGTRAASRPQRPSAEAASEPVGAQPEGLVSGAPEGAHAAPAPDDLLGLARATAADGRQRGVGATSPTELGHFGTKPAPSSLRSRQMMRLVSCCLGCGERGEQTGRASHWKGKNSDTNFASPATGRCRSSPDAVVRRDRTRPGSRRQMRMAVCVAVDASTSSTTPASPTRCVMAP